MDKRWSAGAAALACVIGPSLLSCGKSVECPEGMVEEAQGCVDPAHPYEPVEPLDQNNVVSYGPPLVNLELPAPPKSGFRLVLSSMWLEPGEELFYCHSWQLPDTVHDFVYAATLYSMPGLHHGNMYATEIDPEKGPQPYPSCHDGAASHIGTGVMSSIAGNVSEIDVPDVMFANTTQVLDSEEYRFPAGYAYPLRPGREVVMDTHLYNPSDEKVLVEVAYDFYTMPAELVTHEVAPFVFLWLDFELPPQADSTLTASCDWFGGEVAAIMPHMHEWATGFEVSYRDESGAVTAAPYDEGSFVKGESQVAVLDPAVDTKQAVSVSFSCHYRNTTDHPMCMGIGENEMCFLFGYMTPADKQAIGLIPTEGAPCVTISGSDPESTPFNPSAYLETLEPEVQERVIELFTGGDLGGGSTCPDKSPATPVPPAGGDQNSGEQP